MTYIKTEVIEYLKSDKCDREDIELLTLNWVNWFKKKMAHNTITIFYFVFFNMMRCII